MEMPVTRVFLADGDCDEPDSHLDLNLCASRLIAPVGPSMDRYRAIVPQRNTASHDEDPKTVEVKLVALEIDSVKNNTMVSTSKSVTKAWLIEEKAKHLGSLFSYSE
jgi:hypothetical protein